jgi:glycosyltransferase involved in cell wall biosynthesis
MKILYLCSDSGIPVLGHKGGAVHVREMIGAFRRAGHHVMLAAQVLQKDPWQKPAELDARVLHVPISAGAAASVAAVRDFERTLGLEERLGPDVRRILYNRELVTELRRRLDAFRPDFIYERASLMGIAGVLLSRELGVPLILEVNAPVALEQGTYRSNGVQPLASQAERWLWSKAGAVLAVSAELKRHIVEAGVSARKVHVVPNGVNPFLFCSGARDRNVRRRLGLKEEPVIGFVGGLKDWHGVESLPELLEKLRRSHRSLQMLIVGDGPMRPALEEQFRKRKLTRGVRFIGSVPHEQVPGILREIDIALAPYPALDHFFYFSPLKLFEYMACGVAVVAANSGQISEIISDGQTGLLYKPGNIGALIKACDRLLKDAALRRRIGEAGCEMVHRRYTWDHNARRISDLANEIGRQREGHKGPRRNRDSGRKLIDLSGTRLRQRRRQGA